MKVLLNDGLEQEGIRLFQDARIETDSLKRDGDKLVADIGRFDALIVRSATKVTREVIEAGAKGKLKVIGRAGVGYDNIDVAAASENGIVVKSAPYGSTNAVAELTIGASVGCRFDARYLKKDSSSPSVTEKRFLEKS